MKLFRSLSPLTKLIALLLLVIIGYFELSQVLSGHFHWENPPRQIGTRDFIAFWAAYQVFRAGEDPYTGEEVLKIQNSIIKDWQTPQVFLNPPWALVVLSPFLAYDFPVARWMWVAWNIFFLVGSAYVLARFMDNQHQISHRYIFLIAVCFLPGLMTIWVGQLSLYIAFCTFLAFFCFKHQRDFLGGILLIPLTLKPHTLFLVFLTSGLWVLQQRRWKIVFAFTFGFLLVLSLTLLRSPDIFTWWIQMDFSPLIFQTPTLVSLLRKLIQSITDTVPIWPAYVFPLVGIMIACIKLARQRFQIEWESDLPLLATLSLIFAPYVWFHDFTLLLCVHLGVLIRIHSATITQNQRVQTFLLLASAQLLLLVTGMLTKNLFYLFWFPWAMLFIWVQTERMVRTRLHQ